ncbi:MAG: glycolate oxidase subunit GlcF [Alphaproteobacteria bacterium]
MKTEFNIARLADNPQLANSEKILRTCVHCGFCNATCPTYLLLGDELDGPRGRIYLIKEMLENDQPASKEVVTHVDRCLSCLSCMSTCPSGVHYMHLVDHARTRIEETYQRSWHDRLIRGVLSWVLPYPRRFRMALRVARLGRPLRGAIGTLPAIGPRMRAMLELAPRGLPARPKERAGQVFPAIGERKKRIALLANCAQPVLDPGINQATIRLLNRLGVEVVLTEGEGCCGALVHHMGKEAESHAFAIANINAWHRELDGDGLDAIIITASGCGTTIKDYGHMLRDDPRYATKAARISELAMDISELLETLDLTSGRRELGLRVAYHSACSMQHGQQLKDGPKRLLEAVGFEVATVPEGHICCGSAGTYNILQPKIARELRDRKVININLTGADIVATGNIGCMVQIGSGNGADRLSAPIVHTVELIDWATGGPRPQALEGLESPPPESSVSRGAPDAEAVSAI